MKSFRDSVRQAGYLAWMKFILALVVAAAVLMPVHAQPHRPSILLLVDDDEAELLLQNHYLKSYHVLVTECRRSEEGLKLLKANFYDFAFVDLFLDDGRTAIDLIKEARPRNANIGFYVVSDYGRGPTGSRLLNEVMQLDNAPYAVKPITKLRFAKNLEWLPLRRRK